MSENTTTGRLDQQLGGISGSLVCGVVPVIPTVMIQPSSSTTSAGMITKGTLYERSLGEFRQQSDAKRLRNFQRKTRRNTQVGGHTRASAVIEDTPPDHCSPPPNDSDSPPPHPHRPSPQHIARSPKCPTANQVAVAPSNTDRKQHATHGELCSITTSMGPRAYADRFGLFLNIFFTFCQHSQLCFEIHTCNVALAIRKISPSNSGAGRQAGFDPRPAAASYF